MDPNPLDPGAKDLVATRVVNYSVCQIQDLLEDSLHLNRGSPTTQGKSKVTVKVKFVEWTTLGLLQGCIFYPDLDIFSPYRDFLLIFFPVFFGGFYTA